MKEKITVQSVIPLRDRSFKELILRVKKGNILNDQEIIDIVEACQTVTAVNELVGTITKNTQKAQSARCLFFLRDKHFEEYQKLLSEESLNKNGRKS